MSVSGRWSGWLMVCLCCALLCGCSGCGDRTGNSATARSQGKDKPDSLAAARDLYRKATDAASFRDANEQVNKYLDSQADALAKFQAGTKDPAKLKQLLEARGIDVGKRDDHGVYLQFLQSIVGLDAGELEEAKSGSFRLLDAHYLESCFLLRDIARSMPLEGLSPLERAEFCFRWVVQQVVLQESRDEMLPPQYVLKRGEGSSRERALVFAALVQQLNLDACAIGVPGKDGKPRPCLVGVLIGSGDKTDVFLFDARLGMAMPGPKGRGIATLAQLKAEPTLLDFLKVDGLSYDVDAGQLAKAEILLIAPLSALSARMRFLEELLDDFDRVNLTVRLPELLEKCEQLKAGPVRVWNEPGGKVQTPTNALRLFLPPEEGGSDTTTAGIDRVNRLQTFQIQQTPRAAFLQGFGEEKVLGVDAVSVSLQGIAHQVWLKYALQPAQQLLRGRLEDTRRLMRAQGLGIELEAMQQAGMAEAVAGWKKRAFEKMREDKLAAVLSEDQWLVHTIADPDDEQAIKNYRPQVLSYLVLRAVVKPLQNETEFLLQQRWQEQAERLQVQYELLAAGNAADVQKAKALDKAKQCWQAAVSYGDSQRTSLALSPAGWQAGLDGAGSLMKVGYAPLAVELVEYQLQAIRKAAAARLLGARALQKTGKQEKSVESLKKLQSDLAETEKLVTRDNLRPILYQPAVPTQRDEIGKAIDRMVADCGPGGSLFWMRFRAAMSSLPRSPARP